MKVCLVTEELSSIGRSGGIGAAFEELSILLARNGAKVVVLYTGTNSLTREEQKSAQHRFEKIGVCLEFLNPKKYAWPDSAEANSYAVFKHLTAREEEFDVIHFHEYHGVGFFSVNAKRQGLAFSNTQLVIQLHGMSEWAIEANADLPWDVNTLKNFHLERGSIAGADWLVSPSEYLFGWMSEYGVEMIDDERRRVIHNVCTNVVREIEGKNSLETLRASGESSVQVDEIIMFGRHEPRKGFTQFVAAVNSVSELLAEKGVKVTFLGRFGSVNGQHSGAYLARAGVDWEFPVEVIPDANRDDAMSILASRPNAAVFVPSRYENSPYTVLELLALRKAVFSSTEGGGGELIDSAYHESNLIEMTSRGISTAIRRMLVEGAAIPDLAEDLATTEKKWIEFHNEVVASKGKPNPQPILEQEPKVTLGITTYERPEKLVDAVVSAVKQTYRNLEVVVIDDGSKSIKTQDAYEMLEPFFARSGVRLIRGENKYLGGARNSIAKETESDFLIFLDDDDYAHPELVSTLVLASLNTGADVTTCFNVFMPESERYSMLDDLASYERPVSYVPIGGPLSVAPIQNSMGSATALIKREAFEAVGGYTELKGVGHEDYELFLRFLQSGRSLEVVPRSLFLYEVDRPSMISNTSTVTNFKRVIDAIDTTRNPKAWNEFMAAMISSEARESQRNQKISSSRRDGLWDVEQPLFENAGLQTQVTQLVKLSRVLGASVLEEAFKSIAFRKEAQGSSGLRTFNASHRRIAVRTKDSCNESLSGEYKVYSDLYSGNYEVAIQKAVRQIETRWELTESDMHLLRRILDLSDVPANLFDKILAALEPFKESTDDMAFAKLGMDISLRSSDLWSSTPWFYRYVKAQEADYLSKNQDVAKAVEDGSFESAFVHFAKNGFKENRRGFESLKALIASNGGTLVEDLFADFSPSERKFAIMNLC